MVFVCLNIAHLRRMWEKRYLGSSVQPKPSPLRSKILNYSEWHFKGYSFYHKAPFATVRMNGKMDTKVQ